MNSHAHHIRHSSLRLAVATVVLALLSFVPVAIVNASAASGRTLSPRLPRPLTTTAVHRQTRVSPRFGPSGVLMPTNNPPGWRRVFSDNFVGNALNTTFWKPYTGVPGGDPNGAWSPTHVVVQNGVLYLKGYQDNGVFTTAGVSSQPALVQTYGKYLVRYRMGAGIGVGHALLLWPASNIQGPEIDFSEENGSNRLRTSAFLHWSTNPNSQFVASHKVNLTQWHTLGVQWTPGRVVYTLDGRPWKTIKSRLVPNIPMVLDLQTQSWCGVGQQSPNTWEHCISPTTPAEVDMDVDWVVAYARA